VYAKDEQMEKKEMCGRRRDEKCEKSFRDRLGNVSVGERIILKWIFQKSDLVT
jgi:hypothetical protein